MLAVLLVFIVCFLVAWAIIKNYNVQSVLIIGGLILLLFTYLFDWGVILPKKVPSSGFILFDPIVYISYLTGYRTGGLGLLIMVLVGFAEYMKYLKADEAVVRIFTKPLLKLKSPYLLLFFSYFIGSVLQQAVPSATGLGVLLMATMFPVMTRLGLSPLSVAGVIATSLSMAYAPTAVDAIRASEIMKIEAVEYVFQYQGRLIIPSLLTAGIVHVFWQSYCDKKDGYVPTKMESTKENQEFTVPTAYAILPFLPIIMAVTFSHYFISTIHISIVTIVFVCIILSLLLHLIYIKDLKEVLNGIQHFFKGMGYAFSSVVSLLIAAGVFAHGISSTGAITNIISGAQSMGLSVGILAIIFALITLIAAIITGSGNAPFLAFIELIPNIATSMGVNPASIILPMQQASHMGRSMSPVSGVVIAVSGSAKLNPFLVVKRVSVPILCAFFVHIIVVSLYF